MLYPCGAQGIVMANTTNRYRAGRYVTQPAGYRAFIPAPLPPIHPIRIDAAMQKLLANAEGALAMLNERVGMLPDVDMFVYMYMRKEAVFSNQIEGTQSSLNDLLEEEAQMPSAIRPKDVAENIRYVAAMNYGIERLKSLPVSMRLVREIHKVLMQAGDGSSHVKPGEIRRSQNWIGPAGCTLKDAAFIPPPPGELGKALSELERFLHAKDKLPLLIKIGLAHAQFETIHPFLDGNGRVGRLLITLLLCERKALNKPALYFSHYLRLHRSEYYAGLNSAREKGDWEGWLEFFLTGMAHAANDAASTARAIILLREKHRNLIVQEFGASAGKALVTLDWLYSHPIISIAQAAEMTGTTYPPAAKLIRRLVDAGILTEATGFRRHRRYRYEDYIRAFE